MQVTVAAMAVVRKFEHLLMQVTGTPRGRLCSLADSLRHTSRLRIGKGRRSWEVSDRPAAIFCLPVMALIQFFRHELDRKRREFCIACSSSVCSSISYDLLMSMRVFSISFFAIYKKIKVQVSSQKSAYARCLSLSGRACCIWPALAPVVSGAICLLGVDHKKSWFDRREGEHAVRSDSVLQGRHLYPICYSVAICSFAIL